MLFKGYKFSVISPRSLMYCIVAIVNIVNNAVSYT